jgi:hypothetical protein
VKGDEPAGSHQGLVVEIIAGHAGLGVIAVYKQKVDRLSVQHVDDPRPKAAVMRIAAERVEAARGSRRGKALEQRGLETHILQIAGDHLLTCKVGPDERRPAARGTDLQYPARRECRNTFRERGDLRGNLQRLHTHVAATPEVHGPVHDVLECRGCA